MAQEVSTWDNWKVFIIGGLSAMLLALQEIFTKSASEQDTKVFVLAAVLALLSYVAKEWRGKGMTIFGVIGTAATVITAQLAVPGYEINWFQMGVAIMLAVIGSVIPNPKPDTYETNATIVQAKSLPPRNQVPDPSPAIPPANKHV